MNPIIAEQIARLVNEFSPITIKVSPEQVTGYLWEGDGEGVAACVKVERMNWYQWEVSHLVVHPSYRRAGVGLQMCDAAIDHAKRHGCRVIQCTIRSEGSQSRKICERLGFKQGVEFVGPSGHKVQVWQKSL